MALPTEALVVDASVAVKWHLGDEDHVAEAALLLDNFAQGRTGLCAPEYIRYEVPAAIARATRGLNSRLSKERGREAIEEFLSLGIQTLDSADLTVVAYELAHTYGCALYDALYVALAERLSLPFVTADRRLYEQIRSASDVIWIGDYS